MDFDDSNNDNNNEMWEWQEKEYNLQSDPQDDVSQYLCYGVNKNEDNLLYMLDEQTPIKDCVDFGYQVSDIGDNGNKGLWECREPSQLKRRRMLQFTSDTNDTAIGYEQSTSVFLKSKAREGSLMEDELSENLQWDSQWNLGFPGFDQSSCGWLANCLNESETHYNLDEMNDLVVSDDQVSISEFYNMSPEMETDVMRETPLPAHPEVFRGKKSFIKTPRKLTTSVAYPFALIKPCGVQGDVTLKDINQRIHAPPPSRSKHVKDDDPSLCYPTSAFSGKPVVVKTKIRTEGGKGSITIMRTKG